MTSRSSHRGNVRPAQDASQRSHILRTSGYLTLTTCDEDDDNDAVIVAGDHCFLICNSTQLDLNRGCIGDRCLTPYL